MEKICQCINSLILQESVYIEIRHGEDLSVYQFSDPTRECVYIYIYIYEGSFIINRKMPVKSAFFMLSTKFLHVFIP